MPSKVRRTSSSLRVFRCFIAQNADGSLDVSKIISRDCYLAWLELKGVAESDEQAQKFRRTLTNHVSGTDGRCPLEPEEEVAVLALLRQKLSWPCFPKHLAFIGKRYRSRGYHELLALQPLLTPHALTPAASAAEEMDDLKLSPTGMVKDTPLCEDAACPTLLEDELYKTIRRIILSKTANCPPPPTTTTLKDAQKLCDFYSFTFGVLVTVMDMTSKRIVAQNPGSQDFFGVLVGAAAEGNHSIWEEGEMSRVTWTICEAYHQPGTDFTIPDQELRCQETQLIKRFDMTYMVDPSTFLLITRGEASFLL